MLPYIPTHTAVEIDIVFTFYELKVYAENHTVYCLAFVSPVHGVGFCFVSRNSSTTRQYRTIRCFRLLRDSEDRHKNRIFAPVIFRLRGNQELSGPKHHRASVVVGQLIVVNPITHTLEYMHASMSRVEDKKKKIWTMTIKKLNVNTMLREYIF